jgi:hypothetical protein
MVGPAMMVEPVFSGGAVPHYRELVDHLLRTHAAAIEAGLKRGVRYGIEIRHDDDCPALTDGGCCDCDCVVNLVERGDPSRN